MYRTRKTPSPAPSSRSPSPHQLPASTRARPPHSPPYAPPTQNGWRGPSRRRRLSVSPPANGHHGAHSRRDRDDHRAQAYGNRHSNNYPQQPPHRAYRAPRPNHDYYDRDYAKSRTYDRDYDQDDRNHRRRARSRSPPQPRRNLSYAPPRRSPDPTAVATTAAAAGVGSKTAAAASADNTAAATAPYGDVSPQSTYNRRSSSPPPPSWYVSRSGGVDRHHAKRRDFDRGYDRDHDRDHERDRDRDAAETFEGGSGGVSKTNAAPRQNGTAPWRSSWQSSYKQLQHEPEHHARPNNHYHHQHQHPYLRNHHNHKHHHYHQRHRRRSYYALRISEMAHSISTAELERHLREHNVQDVCELARGSFRATFRSFYNRERALEHLAKEKLGGASPKLQALDDGASDDGDGGSVIGDDLGDTFDRSSPWCGRYRSRSPANGYRRALSQSPNPSSWSPPRNHASREHDYSPRQRRQSSPPHSKWWRRRWSRSPQRSRSPRQSDPQSPPASSKPLRRLSPASPTVLRAEAAGPPPPGRPVPPSRVPRTSSTATRPMSSASQPRPTSPRPPGAAPLRRPRTSSPPPPPRATAHSPPPSPPSRSLPAPNGSLSMSSAPPENGYVTGAARENGPSSANEKPPVRKRVRAGRVGGSKRFADAPDAKVCSTEKNGASGGMLDGDAPSTMQSDLKDSHMAQSSDHSATATTTTTTTTTTTITATTATTITPLEKDKVSQDTICADDMFEPQFQKTLQVAYEAMVSMIMKHAAAKQRREVVEFITTHNNMLAAAARKARTAGSAQQRPGARGAPQRAAPLSCMGGRGGSTHADLDRYLRTSPQRNKARAREAESSSKRETSQTRTRERKEREDKQRERKERERKERERKESEEKEHDRKERECKDHERAAETRLERAVEPEREPKEEAEAEQDEEDEEDKTSSVKTSPDTVKPKEKGDQSGKKGTGKSGKTVRICQDVNVLGEEERALKARPAEKVMLRLRIRGDATVGKRKRTDADEAAEEPPRSEKRARTSPPAEVEPAVTEEGMTCARSRIYRRGELRERAIVESQFSVIGMGSEVRNSREARQEKRRLRKGLQWLGGDGAAAAAAAVGKGLGQRKKAVCFRRSRIHGMGLFAREKIAAGDFVIEYVGELVRSCVADERERAYRRQGMGDSYLFRLNADTVVDATRKGGIARFINHSCHPNVVARTVTIAGDDRIVFYSKKRIDVNEELTYDYKFELESDDDKVACLCRAPNCRGTLN